MKNENIYQSRQCRRARRDPEFKSYLQSLADSRKAIYQLIFGIMQKTVRGVPFVRVTKGAN